VPVGGHNLLEPAALGVPCLAGPHQGAAPQVARELLASGAMKTVNTPQEFTAALLALAADEPARRALSAAALAVVAANRGALERLLELIRARLA
jgi:3-deoxy-D-manno-octulosonic-acid transferase